MIKRRSSDDLYRDMCKLSAKLAQIGVERDEAQIDELQGYKLADLQKLVRDWEMQLAEIVSVENQWKKALIAEGILPSRGRSKPKARRKSERKRR